jgi:GR25 family glycosyltransferase involved in LPS biosynthesis
MRIDIDSIPVVVINLPERTERLATTRKQLDSFYGVENKEFHIVQGIRTPQSFVGIANAHQNAVKLAKDNGWPMVCIVEDDVHFQSASSRSYAEELYADVPEDFDVLLSGIYTGSYERTDKRWFRVSEFSALHYYIVAEKAYDRILAFGRTSHIDRWMCNHVRGGNLTVYVPDQFFAIQFDQGYSDNARRMVDYRTLLSKYNVLK